jgi:Tfp pilus assembly protein PilF
LHNPNDVLAWYLRGYVLQTKNRSDLTDRDFRRMVAVENNDAS